MSHRLRAIPTRLVVGSWIVAVVLMAIVVALLLRQASGAQALPTVRSLGMPISRSPLDRTVTIGSRPGVTAGGGSRIDIESRYGQFRGHWWWNHGWVYFSGNVLPGSRIHVHLDEGSLTISEIPDVHALPQIAHFGKYGFLGIIQLDVVRFGIGATLMSNPMMGDPFAGRNVLDVFDQITGRAWTQRGLTITRDHVSSAPANAVRCDALTPPTNRWDLGCPSFGQHRLVGDRRGRFGTVPDAMVEAEAVSLTPIRKAQAQLPTDSIRIEW